MSRRPSPYPIKNQPAHQWLQENNDLQISGQLEETIRVVQQILGENDDFVVRRFSMFGRYPAAIVYISNIVEKKFLDPYILKPLMQYPDHVSENEWKSKPLKEIITNHALYFGELQSSTKITEMIQAVLEGAIALMVDGLHETILLQAQHVEKRAIDQPPTEQVIRGPRDGFIEVLDTNLALLRYRLPTPDFRVKKLRIGRITKSQVAVCYLDGVVNPALVEEVLHRLSMVDIDGILDSGYLEQFIEDNHFSPFPQIQNSERPDKAVADLLEGRVILMVDGSPFALIVPTVFGQFLQTTEDYSERFLLVSFIRLARILALVFSLIFPALYVAIISYNPELIPTEFAVAVSGARAGVPFPAVVEVLIMEISMEVLREATIRLPQQIGGALSIVGVLVIGQAAVAAGFVSPIMVVVIAITTIGSFATPSYNAALALRLLRFLLIILAGIFGLYGVMIGLILIMNHMVSLKSFGVPYLSPIVPGNFQGMKDTFARFPLWFMPKRPALLHTPNDNRIGKQVSRNIHSGKSDTLDPLKVGNERGEDSNGIHPSNHRSASDDHSD